MEYISFLFVLVLESQHLFLLKFKSVPLKPHVCGWAPRCSLLKLTTSSNLNFIEINVWWDVAFMFAIPCPTLTQSILVLYFTVCVSKPFVPFPVPVIKLTSIRIQWKQILRDVVKVSGCWNQQSNFLRVAKVDLISLSRATWWVVIICFDC